MRFDDRLSTVLAQAAGEPRARAVRWRQLVELVARSGREGGGALVAEALAEIRTGAGDVDESVRASTARAVSSLPLPFGLVAAFAADEIQVAAPVLGAAELSPTELKQLIVEAREENRRFLLSLYPQTSAEAGPAGLDPVENRRSEGPIPSISEVLARIERLAQSREQDAAPEPAGSGKGAALFRWECGPSGEIAWVDGAPRGAMIGRSIAQPSEQEEVDPAIGRAFSYRTPFSAAKLVLAGDADWAGEWQVSGIPAFEPADGRFAGYRGVARRRAAASGAHDSLRELVHEIKTPLTAIIGFAEIIDGEMFGPAGERYRGRAAEIVSEARLLLDAIDDLDLVARLRSGREAVGLPVNAAELIARLRSEFTAVAAQRSVSIGFDTPPSLASCRVEPMIGERLVRRLLELALSAVGGGQELIVCAGASQGRCTLLVHLPKEREGPLEPFRLRLLEGLARLAGGELVAESMQLKLTLPDANGAPPR
ncbi:MAG: hypothetical protein M3Q52_03580 [Pseudomonadota bacterium]|nr:hypothetical protein [Pseudomonadota bacterium]